MKAQRRTAPWLAPLLLPLCLFLSACLQSDTSLMPQTLDPPPFAGTYILKTVRHNSDNQKFDILKSKILRLTAVDGRLKGESEGEVPDQWSDEGHYRILRSTKNQNEGIIESDDSSGKFVYLFYHRNGPAQVAIWNIDCSKIDQRWRAELELTLDKSADCNAVRWSQIESAISIYMLDAHHPDYLLEDYFPSSRAAAIGSKPAAAPSIPISKATAEAVRQHDLDELNKHDTHSTLQKIIAQVVKAGRALIAGNWQGVWQALTDGPLLFLVGGLALLSAMGGGALARRKR